MKEWQDFCVFEKGPDGYCRCVRGGCGFVYEKSKPENCSKIRRICTGTGPGHVRQAINVTKAAVKHVKNEMKVVSKEVEERRASICPGCELYATKDGGKTHYCSHMNCGCGVDQIENYWSKIKLESEKCPHPKGNKWEMTDEELKSIGHPERPVSET